MHAQLPFFTDDCGLVVEVQNISILTSKLEEACRIALKWGHGNHLEFDDFKTEAVLFTRSWKVKTRAARVAMILKGHTFKSSSKATCWLGV